MPVDEEKNKLQNYYLGFFEIFNILDFFRFFQHFFFIFSKNPPNFKINKTENMY